MPTEKVSIIYTVRDTGSKAVKGLAANVKQLGASFLKSRLGLASLALAIGLAIKDFSDFETKVTDVGNLFSATDKQINDLKGELIALSKEVPHSATALAEALFDVVSAGVPAGESIKFLNTAARLATAGVTSVTVAVDGLTSVMNAYSLEASEAERLSDKFFAAQREGKTTIEELSSSIGQVAPLAKSAGVSIDTLLGSVAALTKQGISTSQAVTSIRSALAGIIAPGTEAQELAGKLGLEFGATALKAKGLTKFLQDVIEKTGGNEQALKILFGRIEAVNGILALSNDQFRGLAEIEGLVKDATDETANAFDKQSKTIGFAFQSMKNEFLALTKTLVNVFKPAIIGVIKGLELLAKWTVDVGKALKILGDAYTKYYRGIGAVREKDVQDEAKAQEEKAAIQQAAIEAAAERQDEADEAAYQKKLAIRNKEVEDLVINEEQRREIEATFNELRLKAAELNTKFQIKRWEDELKSFSETRKQMTLAEQKETLKQLKIKLEANNVQKQLEREQLNRFTDMLSYLSIGVATQNKEAFAIGKAAAIVNATISAHEAFNKVLAHTPLPPPFNYALAAATFAVGVARVSQIASQRLELAEGGIVRATPGGTQAIIGEGGRDEAVIPLDDEDAKERLGLGLDGKEVTIVLSDGRELAKGIYQLQSELIRDGEIDAR